MKYCKQCGKVVGETKNLCPYCGGKSFLDSNSEEYRNRPVSVKRQLPVPGKKKNKAALVAVIAAGVIVLLGILFVVLDMTRVIPTGIFTPSGVYERFIDDDGDARSRESDERIISETVEYEEGE
ncbi:MAG: hypothetical protein UH734_00310 [Ruminococcus sp.]|nr:hypothetical protein [Ruminococcus sp.]